jgi:cyclase
MVAKRIIACLDIRAGRTVKGTKFLNLKDVGDPVRLAARYSAEGADELVFLDISATEEERMITLDTVRLVARELSIPFTVGGGVTSVSDVQRLLAAGADKVALNSAAVRNPNIIDTIATEFGSQCLVVAIDTVRTERGDSVFIQGGKVDAFRETERWACEVAQRGAGEILLTSMDHDGTRGGFACELTARISEALSVPVIASGGAGELSDFATVFRRGRADAALAAGIFHDGVLAIGELKRYLREQGVEVRI